MWWLQMTVHMIILNNFLNFWLMLVKCALVRERFTVIIYILCKVRVDIVFGIKSAS